MRHKCHKVTMEQPSQKNDFSRRRFLKVAAGAGGALAVGGPGPAFAASTLPNPNRSGIDHIIVVMMENRSFDHFLGWLPAANGRQAGLTYLDSNGVPHSTYALATDDLTGDFQGCGKIDPNHSFEGGRVEYDSGACDGWLKEGANPDDDFSIGYYPQAALDFLGRASPDWTVCSNYFCALMAETQPNRFYMHAAATDRLHNALAPSGSSSSSFSPSKLPTIWDRLAGSGHTGRYYYSDVPFLALWGQKYLPISFPISQFFTDAAAGQLPDVAFIDPRFEGEEQGITNDDHPHADIRAGEFFLNQIYTAVVTSPNWSSTVLVIDYDEWGGFFDHVPPPIAPVPRATKIAGIAEGLDVNSRDFGLLGFRVPNVLISPFAKRGFISRDRFDHTSILKMIEWRFGLAPLTVRDRTADNLAEVLNFHQSSTVYNTYTVPPVASLPCPVQPAGVGEDEFTALGDVARSLGFPSP